MLTLNTYKIRALQYQHLDDSQVLQDFRTDRQVTPPSRHVYYAGFEIRTPSDILYHHMTFMADTHESLCHGVEVIQHHLEARFLHANAITLIYLRSYSSLDTAFIDPRTQENIRDYIEESAHIRKLDYFVAFGLRKNGKIEHISNKARHAFDSFEQLRRSASICSLEDLTLLGVFPAHPIALEYNEHFDYAKDRLNLMIDESINWEACVVN